MALKTIKDHSLIEEKKGGRKMGVTKEELAVYQIITLLADKHNCHYVIDFEQKTIDFSGNDIDETNLAEELAIVFPRGEI